MLRYKRESLIPDNAADKKLNATADKAVDAGKYWDIVADTKLNTLADKALDADKWQDAVAAK